MEKRERKEKKQGKRGRVALVGLICAVLAAVGVYLWFFLLQVTPLPEGVRSVLYTPEPTAAPEPTPAPTAVPEPEPAVEIPVPEVSIYTAKLRVEEQAVRGSMRLHYVNTAEETVYSVPFHLYPNTVTPGTISVHSLSLDGRAAYYVAEGDLLNVPLAVELAPGEDCVVYMEFTVVPDAVGYGADGSLAYILPAACVYEHGWITDVPPEDASYTAPAVYSVILEGLASCSIPQSESGHYYSENAQGLTLTLQ